MQPVHTFVTFSGRTLLGVRGFGLKILATDVLILDFTIYEKTIATFANEVRLGWIRIVNDDRWHQEIA